VATSPDRAWQLGPAFRPLDCGPGTKGLAALDNRCLFVRAGGCTPLARRDLDVNAALVRRGE
jgi:hypothetical protein